MSPQELRALQEAYLSVYELDEEKVELKDRNKNEMQRKAGNLGREVVSTPNTKKNAVKRTAAMDRMGKLVSAIASDDEDKRFDRMPTREEFVDEAKKKPMIKVGVPKEKLGYKVADIGPGGKEYNVKTYGAYNEQADLYDIILSHLLDEGYADTQEAAIYIMANMSEDWRESILSEDPVQDYRDMKRADQNRSGIRGRELSHDTTLGLKGKPQPGSGSVTQKLTVRGREFTIPPS